MIPTYHISKRWIFTLISMAILAGCGKAPPEQEPLRAVKVLTVGASATAYDLEFSGEVRARIESTLGFRVAETRAVVHGAAGLLGYYDTMGRQRPTLPYDIDGVVYKVNRRDQQAQCRQLDFVAALERGLHVFIDGLLQCHNRILLFVGAKV